ncbi:PAS domain-containing protein [Noviherbaspirillum malthae]|uniref:PAS domain-containing protein n=1 Tax=Noviherbaspirillum malthae TaxID=1260987 RepID=UPI0018900A58|nr:PAS domain-containing protein [Noviherbaspirillum malthae]
MTIADATLEKAGTGTVPAAEDGTDFSRENIVPLLSVFSKQELDALDFGVIGFDKETVVRQYNRFESECAGLAPEHVVGQRMFTSVAPCMNNFMVAQRFEDALENATELDAVIDYVLTLRMRPVKVRLRLLARPDSELRYVLVDRSG